MKAIAFLLDDSDKLFPVALEFPALAVLVSYLLIRWHRKLVPLALVLTTILQVFVVVPFWEQLGHFAGSVGSRYPGEYSVGIAVAVLFPYLMIAVFAATLPRATDGEARRTRTLPPMLRKLTAVVVFAFGVWLLWFSVRLETEREYGADQVSHRAETAAAGYKLQPGMPPVRDYLYNRLQAVVADGQQQYAWARRCFWPLVLAGAGLLCGGALLWHTSRRRAPGITRLDQSI